MPDVWSRVAELDVAAQERLAAVLETRGADPQQQGMRRAFLGDIRFPTGARVLEVGCGTGVMSRMLARLPTIGSVTGVDPARSLLVKARSLPRRSNSIGRAPVPFRRERKPLFVLEGPGLSAVGAR